MAASVTILHGPIRSGKTTRLAGWAEANAGVGGLLQPEGPDGRLFRDLATSETEPLEPVGDRESALVVGRYRFRARAFDWAQDRLAVQALDEGLHTLIVDEIGPLELSGGGLRAALLNALSHHEGELLLVVRTPLVASVREVFGLDHASVIAAADWPHEEQVTTRVP